MRDLAWAEAGVDAYLAHLPYNRHARPRATWKTASDPDRVLEHFIVNLLRLAQTDYEREQKDATQLAGQLHGILLELVAQIEGFNPRAMTQRRKLNERVRALLDSLIDYLGVGGRPEWRGSCKGPERHPCVGPFLPGSPGVSPGPAPPSRRPYRYSRRAGSCPARATPGVVARGELRLRGEVGQGQDLLATGARLAAAGEEVLPAGEVRQLSSFLAGAERRFPRGVVRH